MSCALFADTILILHAAFIAVVVLSVPLIIAGGLLDWRWVKSPLFRFTHLGMIGFVAVESIAGMECPLTAWENRLRTRAGMAGYGGRDFIATWLDRLLFYHFPPAVFTVTYIAFAVLVAGLFYFVPVRKKCGT